MSKRIGNEDLINQQTGPVKMDAGPVAEPTPETPSTDKTSTPQGAINLNHQNLRIQERLIQENQQIKSKAETRN